MFISRIMKTHGISAMLLLLSFTMTTMAARTKIRLHAPALQCCCKKDKCRLGSEGTIYQPDDHLCCKQLKTCKSTISHMHDYNFERSEDFCVKRMPAADLPQWIQSRPPPLRKEEIEPGTHADTLYTHCKQETANDDEDDSTSVAANHAMSMFAKELTDNSVLASSRELFTMYACIRWAPDMQYWKLAEDELETGQLPHTSRAAGDDALLLTARAAERGQFIPLRCSENIGVYDNKNSSHEHFPVFESRINAMSSFFKQEFKAFFDYRARKVEAPRPWEFFWTKNETTKKRWTELLEDTHIFDMKMIKKALKTCEAGDAASNVRDATGEELLKDCNFLQWWAPKLQIYTDRFPFQGFLAGSKEQKFTPGNRVLLCFGKRVAGELHRRKEGSHILTDMNGVGCHGFWDFDKAAKMLQNIVQLWAPPTCVLTELELKMRARMLSMFAEMNKKLFEALPALIASEQFNDAHPSATETGGVKSLLAGGKWVANKMSALYDTYKALGELMTSSVMKWSVCPIGKTEGLDKVLGSDDLLVQKYTQEAYSQWTKQDVALPGETCQPMSDDREGTEKCSIGKVRQDYPEKYKNVEYACPALPLLPAAQQLKILKDKHITKCLIKASPEQQAAESWHYNGLRPAEVQHQPKGHSHNKQMEMVMILDQRSNLDEFGISRSYVALGRVCTLEVQEKYPLWCQKPAVINAPTIGDQLSSAASEMVGTATGMAARLSMLGSNNDKAGWKSYATRQVLGLGAGISNIAHSLSPSALFNLASSMGGASRERYERITRNRLIESLEAGHGLWDMTFQSGEEGGGERNQFDRYVVTVPCDGIDVREEIASEFTWGQVALELLEKASKHLKTFIQAQTFTASVRTEVELHTGKHMERVHQLAWQASDDEWSTSEDSWPHTSSLFELKSPRAVDTSMPPVFGAALTYSCGSREDIYNKRTSSKSFYQCVMDGSRQAEERAAREGREANAIEQRYAELHALQEQLRETQERAAKDGNGVDLDQFAMVIQKKEAELQELLTEKPLTLKEYDDEIVVRVGFANSFSKCQFYSGSLDQVSQAGSGSGNDVALEDKKNMEAAEAMKRKASGCTSISSPTKHKGEVRSGIVGAYMGNAAPQNTREEVILSPLDVKKWLVMD